MLLGKLSLSQKGAIFCKKQIGEAVIAFRKVLAGDDSWLEVLDELELQEEFDEDPESSDEEQENSDSDNDKAVAEEIL